METRFHLLLDSHFEEFDLKTLLILRQTNKFINRYATAAFFNQKSQLATLYQETFLYHVSKCGCVDNVEVESIFKWLKNPHVSIEGRFYGLFSIGAKDNLTLNSKKAIFSILGNNKKSDIEKIFSIRNSIFNHAVVCQEILDLSDSHKKNDLNRDIAEINLLNINLDQLRSQDEKLRMDAWEFLIHTSLPLNDEQLSLVVQEAIAHFNTGEDEVSSRALQFLTFFVSRLTSIQISAILVCSLRILSVTNWSACYNASQLLIAMAAHISQTELIDLILKGMLGRFVAADELLLYREKLKFWIVLAPKLTQKNQIDDVLEDVLGNLDNNEWNVWELRLDVLQTMVHRLTYKDQIDRVLGIALGKLNHVDKAISTAALQVLIGLASKISVEKTSTIVGPILKMLQNSYDMNVKKIQTLMSYFIVMAQYPLTELANIDIEKYPHANLIKYFVELFEQIKNSQSTLHPNKQQSLLKTSASGFFIKPTTENTAAETTSPDPARRGKLIG